MTLHGLLGLGALVALVAVVVFAFRQGWKVKPDGSGNQVDDRSIWP